MNNHCLINPATGKEEWISRSIAVLAIVIGIDKYGNFYVLANKRGEGTPDPEYIGCWCLPCGYLDYDETTKEAISREVFEETGVDLSPRDFKLIYVNDNPTQDKRQNVTFRFVAYEPKLIEDVELSSRNSEENEVSDIGWISLEEFNNYNWAFGHEKIIESVKTEVKKFV